MTFTSTASTARHLQVAALVATAAIAAGAGCGDDGDSDSADPAGGPDAGTPAMSDGGVTGDDGAPDAGDPAPARTALQLPDGDAGIGFDDLQYSATLDRLIVPAARAGYVALIEPRSGEVTRLEGFSVTDSYASGHDFGTTSAIEAEGLVYAIDRSSMELVQIDPEDGERLAVTALGASPDYVRFVPTTRELWVTEPTSGRFEIFALGDGSPPSLSQAGEMPVAGGPESMVVADDGVTAYTNTFLGQTVRIDTGERSESMRMSNGCTISLGIALDAMSERIFVGCAEGKAVVLDAADGAVLSELAVAGGVDIIAYNDRLEHLYLNGSAEGVLTIVDVDDEGSLGELATLTTAPSTNSSCVASDPYDQVWVCDANAGQLLRFTDHY
ncbi:MAG: hypothetical protein PVI30_14710 [Myxococcales bacterium]|jgi:hypothetical protein